MYAHGLESVYILCFQEILPTARVSRRTSPTPNHNSKTSLIVGSLSSQAQGTLHHQKTSTVHVKTQTSSIIPSSVHSTSSSSRLSIKAGDTSSLSVIERIDMTSEYERSSNTSNLHEISKKLSERNDTDFPSTIADTSNKFQFKTNPATLRISQTVNHKEEVISEIKTIKSILSSMATPIAQNQSDTKNSETLNALYIKQTNSQSSLAISFSSHHTPGESNQSNSLIKESETLRTTISFLVSKTIEYFSNEPTESTSSFNFSVVHLSNSFTEGAKVSHRTFSKDSLSSKQVTATSISSIAASKKSRPERNNPVSITRSMLITSLSSPVSVTRSMVMNRLKNSLVSVTRSGVMTSSSSSVPSASSLVLTSSSNMTDTNGGKSSKKSGFVLVFFTILSFAIIVGLGALIKMKQK